MTVGHKQESKLIDGGSVLPIDKHVKKDIDNFFMVPAIDEYCQRHSCSIVHCGAALPQRAVARVPGTMEATCHIGNGPSDRLASWKTALLTCTPAPASCGRKECLERAIPLRPGKSCVPIAGTAFQMRRECSELSYSKYKQSGVGQLDESERDFACPVAS
ncbi:hypothetical protein Pst134EB_026048 [Puccinia striiformis f. sp. tritici]|nr:hypothetical protein Pst134EB_026048 [Puccinia striiformis f. sp. tritici]